MHVMCLLGPNAAGELMLAKGCAENAERKGEERWNPGGRGRGDERRKEREEVGIAAVSSGGGTTRCEVIIDGRKRRICEKRKDDNDDDDPVARHRSMMEGRVGAMRYVLWHSSRRPAAAAEQKNSTRDKKKKNGAIKKGKAKEFWVPEKESSAHIFLCVRRDV